MELTHQLMAQLKQLRLSGILATLEARHRQAIDGKWSYIEFVERLLEDEVERRAQKQLTLRVRRAALNTTKTLEGFDFSFNPSINRQHILQLASGDYIRQKRNVLICGPSGVGKTHPTHCPDWAECSANRADCYHRPHPPALRSHPAMPRDYHQAVAWTYLHCLARARGGAYRSTCRDQPGACGPRAIPLPPLGCRDSGFPGCATVSGRRP